MRSAVGIDLGTTNSVVAVVGRDGLPVVIPNELGQRITPSAICFQAAGPLVGERAREIQELGSGPIAAFFKPRMGDDNFTVNAYGRDYSATDLSALVLKELKNYAQAHLRQSWCLRAICRLSTGGAKSAFKRRRDLSAACSEVLLDSRFNLLLES